MNLQYPFALRGSDQLKHWNEITNNQWQHLLAPHWKDKGFHFYRRMRERGAAAGINTPSDLEAEIRKGIVSPVAGFRYEIDLNIVTRGRRLKVIYDFRSKICQLVTLTY